MALVENSGIDADGLRSRERGCQAFARVALPCDVGPGGEIGDIFKCSCRYGLGKHQHAQNRHKQSAITLRFGEEIAHERYPRWRSGRSLRISIRVSIPYTV